MDLDTKLRLSRLNDMGIEAVAIRLRAARRVTGMQQKDFAAAAGQGKTALNNAEAGLSYPSREIMKFLYRAHRIDFNFILNGDFAQLPSDVQENLFAALEVAANEWDRKERSNQTPKTPKGESKQAQSDSLKPPPYART